MKNVEGIRVEEMPPAFAEETVCAGFQKTVATRGEVVALRTKGGAMSVTWAEYRDRVRRYAAGFAGLGVKSGDAVAFMLRNRPEFNLLDTAAMHLGAVTFSIYNTSSPEQIAYLLSDSGSRIVVTEPAFLDQLRDGMKGMSVQKIVLVEGSANETIPLDQLEAAAPAGFDFEATWRAVSPDALLTIIYTSGTTGPPKGVEITHANMVFELRSFQAARPLEQDCRVISFLPHAHVADRMGTHYLGMFLGGTATTCPDPRQIFEYAKEVRPTEFSGVPRIWEKLKAALEAKVAAEPEERRTAIAGAIEAGLLKVRLEQAGQEVPAALCEGVDRAEEAVFKLLRAAIGLGEARSFFVGAAPTPRDVLEFFHALGMPICEVWGMSELSCVATAMPKDRIRIGTVGIAMPGVELRIAADSEVLVRGPLVMRGYRNKPEMTAETIDRDGWLHTGDIGELDDEGFLKIVDRKKELIINAGGKNMSPANIEARIKTSSPLIGQACVIGDTRPYNVALIVLDPDGAAAFAKSRGLDPTPAVLATSDDVRAVLEEAIGAANSHLSRVEQIKKFEILGEEWQPGGDELTPTMKLKRKPIAKKYAEKIEALYAG